MHASVAKDTPGADKCLHVSRNAGAAAGEGRRAKAERAGARSALARGGAGYAGAAAGAGRRPKRVVARPARPAAQSCR